MKHKRWVGTHDWKRSNDIIDGYSSFNERTQTNTRDLDDLIHWLEYANTGYPATRQTVNQEDYWAGLLRNLLCKELIKELMFFSDNSFRVRCALCNEELEGDITTDGLNLGINTVPCEHLKNRFLDITQHILSEFECWK